MHAQHPRSNSQIFPLVVTMIRKKVYSLFFTKTVICIPHMGESICLPADQKTDIGILCCSFIIQLPTLIQTAHLLTQFYAVYCLPLNGNIFSQASLLALVNKLMELKKYTSHHGMIQSILLFSFYL